ATPASVSSPRWLLATGASPRHHGELRPPRRPPGRLLVIYVPAHDCLVGPGDHREHIRQPKRSAHDEAPHLVAHPDAGCGRRPGSDRLSRRAVRLHAPPPTPLAPEAG